MAEAVLPIDPFGHRRVGVRSRHAVLLIVTVAVIGALIVLAGGSDRASGSVRERWRTWPVDAIFPAQVPGTTRSGASTSYTRLGVASEAPCRTALQPAAAVALARMGCVSVLRATYADITQTYVVTTGIVVLAEEPAARADLLTGMAGAPPERTGPARRADRRTTVRPAPIPGSVAEEFRDGRNVTGGVAHGTHRYVVLTAAGYADGRDYSPAYAADTRLSDLAVSVASSFYHRMTAPACPGDRPC
ncbi:hypothetical protein [Bailinhaonella thermotolerans]|uniref:Uncharacterized protein n=1 Tax=Bailinhaonella thermotolerans TaxID=1070861 RepID=A0A3A4AW73_9ACTN|nr:hypothetical protein [Bailinhaonella thermotolerans]RJL33123.1 hypothetical protein D5H75_09725 [Bailinhaonella thermotolerans]